MKKVLSAIIIPFKFIYTFLAYRYYCLITKNIDYFDYNALIKPNFKAAYGFKAVCAYGHYNVVARMKEKPFNFLTEYIEHGVSYNNNPLTLGYINRLFIKKVYTFGNNRKMLLEEWLNKNSFKRKVIDIGPYIKYAPHFYSMNKLNNIKQKFGKILLAFPSHSIENKIANFDEWNFIKEIEKLRCNFDNVFVCLYWLDALDKEKTTKYLQKEYVILTAGHKNDPLFLSRLKDIIFLADSTMSNDFGTHLGYCVYMNKPHYLYKQPIKYSETQNSDNDNLDLQIPEMFCDAFGQYSNQLSKEQTYLVKRYWGEW